MTENQTPEHPNPDRWWQRKWKAACVGFGFAILVAITGLCVSIWTDAADAAWPYAKLGVLLGFAPMGVFLGIAEINNAIKQIWK